MDRETLRRIKQGEPRGLSTEGGWIRQTADADGQSVEIGAPIAVGGAKAGSAALLVPAARTEEFMPDGTPRCTRCRRPTLDLVVVIEFPGDSSAEPIRICRSCALERPVGRPITVHFSA